MKNGRCRLHGGKSTGPPKGNKNAWKHGRYSREAKELKQAICDLLRQSKKTLAKCRKNSCYMTAATDGGTLE